MNAARLYLTLLLALVLLNGACEKDFSPLRGDDCRVSNAHKVNITQGVWGTVLFWEGDFMPTTDLESPRGKICPVTRELYIHTATPDDSVLRVSSSFFKEIYTRLVAVVISDNEGFYQVNLPPGKYSIFVKEDTLFYAGISDGIHIQPVTVVQDSVQRLDIDITYKAVF